MADIRELMRPPAGPQAASAIGSVFNKACLVTGLAILDGGHRDAPFYLPPTRNTDSPVPGLGAGRFYDARDPGIGQRAWADASYVDAEDLRFSPQVVARGHAGPLTREVIHGVFGFAAPSRFTPQADYGDPGHRQGYGPLLSEWLRYRDADAEPTCCLLDYVRHRSDWLWCLNVPEHVRWSDTRKREYDEAAKRFAEMVGGYAHPEPLLQTFGLPGACEIEDLGGGCSLDTPVQVVAPALIIGGEPPRYGRCFDALPPLAERIAATPLIQL